MEHHEPRVIAVTGGTGHGKTAWLLEQLKGERQVLVWDMKGEYDRNPKHRFTRIEDPNELVRVVSTRGDGRFNFVHPDPREGFALWCEAVYAWHGCTCVAEELADVSNPGKAPAEWGRVVRRGRDRGLTVYGVSQRPTESDSTLFGNATEWHACYIRRTKDRKFVADELDVPAERIAELKRRTTGTHLILPYLHVSEIEGVKAGELRFRLPKTA